MEASPGWGGQEIRILKESLGMQKRGHQIFLGVAKGGGLVEKARLEGFWVEEIFFSKKTAFKAFFQILKIIKSCRIDLVITHSSLDAWIGGMAARILRKPIVRTRHLSTPINGGLNGFLLYNKLADAVATTSDIARKEVILKSKKPKQFCFNVPTGIDPSFADVEGSAVLQFQKKLKKRPDDFLIGTACFMRSWKGIDDFLEAAFLLKEYQDIRWAIIGGGHMQKYMDKAKTLKLDNLVFTGHLENPNAAIAALDAFALLSTAHEGVSQALLQAALLRKPLIGTMTGGIPEVCIHNQTGLIVPSFSPQKVAEAVLKLKESAALACRMGEKAAKLVEKQFTLEPMLDLMEKVYQAALR